MASRLIASTAIMIFFLYCFSGIFFVTTGLYSNYYMSCHFYTNETIDMRYHHSCQGQRSPICNYSVTFDLFNAGQMEHAYRYHKYKMQIYTVVH